MNYDYRPKRQNYTAHAIVILLFLLSGVSFGMAGFFPLPGFLWQVLGLVLLLPAIQLIARYLAAQYLYRLHTYEDGHTDLEIFLYRGGTKMQLLCRVDLAQITAAVPLSKESADVPDGIKRHDYTQDMRPEKALVLTVSDPEKKYQILFSPDEHITHAIETAIAAPHTQEQAAVLPE